MLDVVILINGFSGVGKSTVAPQIASALGIPRLAKDDIKEALWDAMSCPPSIGEMDWSRQLGAASFEVLWRTARSLGPRLILEAPFNNKAWAIDRVFKLSQSTIEVFLHAPAELIYQRHRIRLESQHPCHLPYQLPTLEEIRSGTEAMAPLDLGGPLLEVDLSTPCDVEAVVTWIGDHL